MLRLVRVVRQQNPAQCFGKILGFNLWKLSRLSGVFHPFVGHFFKRAREPEIKLRHVVYEIWLVSYLFFSIQICYFRKWIIVRFTLMSFWFIPIGMNGPPQNVLLNFRLEFPKSDFNIYLPSGIFEIFCQMVSTLGVMKKLKNLVCFSALFSEP